jgi:hypothetical protein
MELAISIENGDLVGRLLYTVSYTALKNLSSILRGNILSLVVDAGREHDVRYILDCTIVEFDEENNGIRWPDESVYRHDHSSH